MSAGMEGRMIFELSDLSGLNNTIILTCNLYGNNVPFQSRNEGRRDQCRLKQMEESILKLNFSGTLVDGWKCDVL